MNGEWILTTFCELLVLTDDPCLAAAFVGPALLTHLSDEAI